MYKFKMMRHNNKMNNKSNQKHSIFLLSLFFVVGCVVAQLRRREHPGEVKLQTDQ